MPPSEADRSRTHLGIRMRPERIDAVLRAGIAKRMHPTITRQVLASLRHVGDDVEVIPHNAEKRLLGVA